MIKTKSIWARVITLVMTVMIACSAMSISTFAASYSETLVTVKRSVDATKAYKAINAKDSTAGGIAVLDSTYSCFQAIATDGDKLEIKYDSAEYGDLEPDEQQKATTEAINTINTWDLSSEARSQIQKKFESDDNLNVSESVLLTLIFAETKADLSTAMKWFSPFQGTVGLILGIGVILVILLLIVSTVFDLVYIGLPMARVAMDGKAEGQGKEKPFGVSYDAIKVVQEGEKDGAGGNMYGKYLKRRIITYIILSLCILYLISGQIAGVIGWLLDLVSGIG